MPDDETEAQKAFESGCLRLLLVALLGYFAVAIVSTVVSVSTGTHWWVLGWFWPHILVAALLIGTSLGIWSEKQ